MKVGKNKFDKALIKKVRLIIIIPVIIELNSNLSEESLWYLYLKNTNVTRKKYPAVSGNRNKLYGII
jgi:hypothetical protein